MLLGIYTSNHVFLLFFKCCCNKYDAGVMALIVAGKASEIKKIQLKKIPLGPLTKIICPSVVSLFCPLMKKYFLCSTVDTFFSMALLINFFVLCSLFTGIDY